MGAPAGAVVFVLLLALGIFGLSRRGRPTVWPRSILCPVLVGLALILIVLTGFAIGGLGGAAVLLVIAAVVGGSPHGFLVLFARPGVVAEIGAALDQIGLPNRGSLLGYDLAQPRATIRVHRLPAGSAWITISPTEMTRKLKLVESVLHKRLSN